MEHLNFSKFPDKRFRTKGELYAHVEQNHPETRKGLVSRLKYKILEPLLGTYNLKAKNLKIGKKRKEKIIAPISHRKSKESVVSYQKRRIAEPVFKTYNLRSMSRKQERAKIAPNINRKRSLRIQKIMKKEKYPIDMDNTILESVQPDFQQSSKRKFEEINETVDYNFKKEESFTSSNKKKILRELQGNEISRKVQTPKNNFARSKENLSSEVLIVNLDPNILRPQTQRLFAEYLGDIKFELFKIHYK